MTSFNAIPNHPILLVPRNRKWKLEMFSAFWSQRTDFIIYYARRQYAIIIHSIILETRYRKFTLVTWQDLQTLLLIDFNQNSAILIDTHVILVFGWLRSTLVTLKVNSLFLLSLLNNKITINYTYLCIPDL